MIVLGESLMLMRVFAAQAELRTPEGGARAVDVA